MFITPNIFGGYESHEFELKYVVTSRLGNLCTALMENQVSV